MTKIQPKDLIAIIVVVMIGILRMKGVNGTLDAPIALILGYYFAHRKDGVDKGQ